MIEAVSLKVVFEVILRTTLIFLVTFVVIRMRGKKQLAQLTLFDILIVIALGSAVGDVMIYPEEVVSLLRSVIAICTLVFLIHLVEYIVSRAPIRVTKIVYGEPLILIKDGKLIKKNFDKANLTEEQFRSMLREKNIEYYSEAGIVRLEPNGKISVKRKKNRKVPKSVKRK